MKSKTAATKRAKPATKKPQRHAALADSLQKELLTLQEVLAKAEFKLSLRALRIEELEKENSNLRSARRGTQRILQDEIRRLEKCIAERDEKMELLNKQLAWLRKDKFGIKSETQTPAKSKTSKPESQENTGKIKKNRGQQPGSRGHGRADRSELDHTVKYLEIPGAACDSCGTPYRLMSRTEASPLTELDVSIVRTIFERCIYVSKCDCQGRKIKVAPPPPKLYPRTEIGNSIWVHLVVRKFLHGMPLNRSLKELSLFGLILPAGTVIGGFKVINDLLAPLVEKLINHCRGADLWNADETTWRVFSEGKKRWWLWLIASDDAVIYLLDPTRSKDVPLEFFAASTGILISDRFSSYKALQAAIKNAWCWVHQRRDILNLYNGIKHLRPWSKSWLEDIALLFVLNHKRFVLWQQGISSGANWDKALLALSLHVDKLKARWEKELQLPSFHKEQKKILRSMKRHWTGLTVFLDDPRIPLHNNRAERLLRNAVILRKNSYGSGTPWAGRMTAGVFSIFQTWLINGLDPLALLKNYFDECSKTPGAPPLELDQFLPWSMSEERKKLYALPASYQRPG